MPEGKQQEQMQHPAMGLPEPIANRQKYWVELTVKEKIERLRTLLKSMVDENTSLRRQLQTFKEHSHDKDGKAVIVKELKNEYGELFGSNTLKQDPDKEYI